jgi:L,D-peptidoglycan transpeptidase YkuD (ErfK/YbiS/YcfS/YnhG family)
VKQRKKEGDRASPAGQFRLLGGFFRPTGRRPIAPWPLRPIRETDGWCDDPRSPAYNRLLPLPSSYSYEKLWRNDGLYDLVIVLDYNLWPQRKLGGSAIFLHCARPDFTPTAGCIALKQEDLRKLLPRLAENVVLAVR